MQDSFTQITLIDDQFYKQLQHLLAKLLLTIYQYIFSADFRVYTESIVTHVNATEIMVINEAHQNARKNYK